MSETPAYSPSFLAALKRTFADEGVHSNSRADRGGDTWYGISRAAYPHIPWPPSRDAATAIFWADFWQRFQIGRLPDPVALKVFDLCVNMEHGPDWSEAVRCLQRACRACGQPIADDGRIGELTVNIAHTLAGQKLEALMAAIRSEAAGYYRILLYTQKAKGLHADETFINGWLRRAYE